MEGRMTYHPAKEYGDKRQLCPGCVKMRSAGQFEESEYCAICTKRGICTPRVSKRAELRQKVAA